MSASVFFITTLLFLGTVLAIFGMKYWSAAVQTRAHAQNEAGYRELAERAATFQSKSAASLASIEADLAAAVARLASVEKILKDVG